MKNTRWHQMTNISQLIKSTNRTRVTHQINISAHQNCWRQFWSHGCDNSLATFFMKGSQRTMWTLRSSRTSMAPNGTNCVGAAQQGDNQSNALGALGRLCLLGLLLWGEGQLNMGHLGQDFKEFNAYMFNPSCGQNGQIPRELKYSNELKTS